MFQESDAQSIFHEARAMEPGSARDAYLKEACAADTALRRAVDALLKADADAGAFLRTVQPARAASATVPQDERSGEASHAPRERSGQTIGRYKLLQPIGEGGFGVVWMAEQDQPVRRRVAIKIIKLGMDTRQVVARFEQERQALALMDHPNIAKVFDAGTTEYGLPYFVMEYVKGDPITDFADAHKLSVAERLALFTQVCQAVQHAHAKGVIHRDLKPRNVLVSMSDGRPFSKVIDFGIAKATGARLTEKTLFTEHQQLIGTPEYMSPEQAEGSPDLDTQTDVYSLGVLLYELLTGATPFDAQRLRSAAYAEMQRIIKEEEPPAPSLRLSRSLATLAATAMARQSEPARLGALIKGELDWIVMKALDKDRARRYETPSQFAADVRRHLDGEAVLAAPPSAAYRIRKFARRHRGPVMATMAVGMVLVAGVIGTSWQWWRAESANSHLREEVKRARLAEATIKYREITANRNDEDLNVDEALATLETVVKTREELLGSDHLETVKAVWLSGYLQRDVDKPSTRRIIEDAAGRLERAGEHPDCELALEYAHAAFRAVEDRLEFDTALRWLRRISAAIPTIYETEGADTLLSIPWRLSRMHLDFGISMRLEGEPTQMDAHHYANVLSSISVSQLLEGAWWMWSPDQQWTHSEERWRQIADRARQILAASPDDHFALTALAAAQRVTETPDVALETVQRAKAARAQAGLPPSAVDAAVTAMSLFALGRQDEARQELSHLRELAQNYDDASAWNRRASLYLAAAEAMIDPQATVDRQLAEQVRQRRLLEANEVMRRRAEFMAGLQHPSPEVRPLGAPSLAELQAAFESRREYYGPDAVVTIDAQFELALATNMEVPHRDLELLRDAADRAEKSGDISQSRLIQILSFASWAHQNSLDFEYASHANSRIADLLEDFVSVDGELPWVWWCIPFGSGRIAGFLGEDSFKSFARDCRQYRGEALKAAVVLNFAAASIRASADPAASRDWLQGALFYATQGLKVDPSSGLCATGLAITRYRLAQYPEALAAAEQAGDLLAKAGKAAHPVHLAVLAMTHFQLGDTDKARSALAQLRAAMSDSSNADSSDPGCMANSTKTIVAEAEALVDPTGNTPPSP